MTRFARAKGSKASNERTPNEATPWHVMKQQLEDNLTKSKESAGKVKSAKELLREKEEPFYYDTIGNINHDWAEFEETNSPKRQKKVNGNELTPVGKGGKKSRRKEGNVDNDSETNKSISSKRKTNEIDGISETEVKSKKLKKTKNADSNKKESNRFMETLAEDSGVSKVEEDKNDATNNENNSTNEKTADAKGYEKLSKRHKRNMKKKAKNMSETDNVGLNATEDDRNIKDDKNEKPSYLMNKFNNKFSNNQNSSDTAFRTFGKKGFENVNQAKKRKVAKIRDDKEHKRRKPDSDSIKMTINGSEVEIVKYDRFPVRKEDAERLKDLKQQMIMKGIPKSEINAAMKLERRKAEKALARLRKCVCFHCRKSGHNLSDCPELGSEQSGTGICFKCGSTEHTHFECKVAKAAEYRFASCFICREQGHIAKQCPDNPRGVYPQGGACKICGDVTHLKKDCPDLVKEKEEATITVDTIANNTLESLEEDAKRVTGKDNKKANHKVVKF